jgi:flagellar FliJ protein
MSRAERLEPLAEFATQTEHEIARRVAVSLQVLRAKEAELAQLRAYLAEYRQRAALEVGSADALRWQNGRAFLARLSAAVAQKEAEIEMATERHRLEVEHWRQARQRARAIEKVIERAAAAERSIADRRSQSELDEVAARFVTQFRS